ncbi:MAG TPA: hypothetical protein ENK60_08295 [Anaerolineae bacterium]|nr:hypothetical protein [Anaerolineae bacterium]
MKEEQPSRILLMLTALWNKSETFIYVLVGLTLLIAALGGLGQLWMSYIVPWVQGRVPLDVLQILDGLLLISMLAEIMQMVKISVMQRRLSSEPFLIVGLISVVRRVLIITAEGSRVISGDFQVAERAFELMMVELAILALLLIVLIYGIKILRQQRLDEARRLREERRQHPDDTPELGQVLGNLE